MIRTCRTCGEQYEDFDYLTYDYTCPKCKKARKYTRRLD